MGVRGIAVVAGALALGGCFAGRTDGVVPQRAQPAPPEAASASAEGLVKDTSAWRGMNAARAEELMIGRFPGVEVVRLASGDLSVRIRGATTLLGSNEPLFVIDGMEISPGPGGALAGINPGDIAKIEVLKDVGSTALYGVRGANGVVLITTRRAKERDPAPGPEPFTAEGAEGAERIPGFRGLPACRGSRGCRMRSSREATKMPKPSDRSTPPYRAPEAVIC